MANALVTINGMTPGENGNVGLYLQVLYTGPDLGADGFRSEQTHVEFPADSTLAAIRDALVAAVRRDATALGITIATNRLIFPTFQKV